MTFGEEFVSVEHRLAEVAANRIRLAEKVFPFGISYLDDVLRGVYPTDLILVAAATGAGKTTLAMLFALGALRQGLRVRFFALEAHRGEIEQRLLFRYITTLAWERQTSGRHQLNFLDWIHGRLEQYTAPLEREAREQLEKDCKNLFTYYRGSRFAAEDITKQFLALQDQTDLIVFDHVHYVDSDDPSENRALKNVTKALRDAALSVEIPVVAVAHLRKEESGWRNQRLLPTIHDLHGSSDLVKIATKVIVLSPARDRVSDERGVAPTYMQVVKERFGGVHGYVGCMDFVFGRLSYKRQYILGRLNYMGNEFTAVHGSDVPEWARNASRIAGAPLAE